MSEKIDRKFVTYGSDFVIDATTSEQKKTAAEWFEESQGKYDVFNPDWEHFKRVVNSDKYSPKTVMLTEKSESPSLEEAAKFVGDYIELVHTRTGAQLVVDESGGLKGGPINSVASQLYGGPIYGPVMILRGAAKWA
jgi:hypothetical protein